MNRLASKKIRARFIALVLFLSLILIPQGATASLVICFESDGQINVEAAYQGVCYQCSINYSYETHYLSLDGENSLMQTHYAPCIDIAISVSDLEQNIVPEHGINKLINEIQKTFFAFPQSLCEENVTEEFSSLFPPLNNSIISSLSSTILLI